MPWRGTVVAIAAGPSLTIQQCRLIGMARAQNKVRVITINDAIYACFYADVMHACDKAWWTLHEGVPHFSGPKTCLEITPYKDVKTLANTGVTGFDEAPGACRSGANGGFQAVHIAAKIWQPKKIILVGYDYSDDGGRSHFWGKYQNPAMDKHSNVQHWRRNLEELTNILGKRGILVANATIKSTITWLPRLSLDQPNWENP